MQKKIDTMHSNKLNHADTRKKVFALANQLVRLGEMTKAEAFAFAWSEVRLGTFGDAEVITFDKVDRKGNRKKASRLVFKQWLNYYQPKGTGRPLKDGQVLFADVARVYAGHPNVIISTYKDRIYQ